MAGASFNVGGFSKGPTAPKPPAPARPGALSGSLKIQRPPAPAALGGLHVPAPARPQVSPTQAAAPKTSATSTAPPTSPLDSTYYSNLAANQLKVQGQLNSLGAQSQNDNTALQNALAQLAYQQPRDSLKLEQGANQRGALYSSAYDQSLGDLQNQYQTRQSADVQSNAQKQAAIQAQIGQIEQGVPLYQTSQQDAAIQRAIKAALANPATGQAPTVTTPAPSAAAAASFAGKPIPKGALKKNGTLNVNVPKVKSGFGYRGGF